MRAVWTLLVLLAAGGLRANDVKPYAEAVKTGKDVLVLCVGTGWMEDCEKYKSAFRNAAQGFSGDVVWAFYDRPSDLTPEQANALGKLPCEVFGYPALVYRDGEGRPLFQREMIPLAALQKLGPVATKTLKLRNDRDIALKAARAMPKGAAKAAALGKALAPLLDPVIATYSERAIGAYQNSVKDIVKEIRAADPTDAEGWALKYSFCYMPIVEGQICKDGYEENCRLIAGHLERPALLPIQRQMLYAMRFKVELDKANAEPEDEGDEKQKPLTAALKALKDGIALDPKSTVAEAMRQTTDYYTKPVMLTDMRWLGKDNRPRWQKATLDCVSVAKVGGLYRVTFAAKAGGTRFRKVRFAGGPAGEDLSGGVWRCRFPGEGKAVLEMELKGSGWFDGHGDIVVTKE